MPFRAASQVVRAAICNTAGQGAIPWRHSTTPASAGTAVTEAKADEAPRRGRGPSGCEFHRSPHVAVPAAPARLAQQQCSRPVSGRLRVQLLRWAPFRRARSTAGRRALNAAIGVRFPGPLPCRPVAQVGAPALEAGRARVMPEAGFHQYASVAQSAGGTTFRPSGVRVRIPPLVPLCGW